MPLTGQQIEQLADELDQQLNDPTLQLYAIDLDVNLPNLTVGATSLKERAVKFITYMNSRLPPRDRELLELVRARGNARLQAVAGSLLTPTFFSPTGDPHDAILLGKTAFVARDLLRAGLRDFTAPSPYTTRVLVVRGDEPGGKSYTWEFLRHLAVTSVGAQPVRLRLRNKGASYTPRDLLQDAFLLLGLDVSALPVLTDDPQLARVDPLITAFKGKIVTLPRPYWLVIDDLNDPSVTPIIRETAFAVAQGVEELKPQHLWLALLGYNEAIVDPELRHARVDDAEFPSAQLVAQHLQVIANASPKPLTTERAGEISQLLFMKFAKLDREAMTQLTVLLERTGEKLKLGQHP